jgi:hypothetical protein
MEELLTEDLLPKLIINWNNKRNNNKITPVSHILKIFSVLFMLLKLIFNYLLTTNSFNFYLLFLIKIK